MAVAARKLVTDGMMPLHFLLDSLLAVVVAVAAESVVAADDHELVAVAARKRETDGMMPLHFLLDSLLAVVVAVAAESVVAADDLIHVVHNFLLILFLLDVY